jgi:hypothetical protein
MKRQFSLLLSVKTPLGFVTYGQYEWGGSSAEMFEFFARLKGCPDAAGETILHIDLMETVDELPCRINTISCTLDELVYNCKLITLETFRINSLKEVKPL